MFASRNGGKGWGKPKGFHKGGQANAQALEMQLMSGANQIWTCLLDKTVSMPALAQQWEGVMGLRARVMGLYGMSSPWAPNGTSGRPAGDFGGRWAGSPGDLGGGMAAMCDAGGASAPGWGPGDRGGGLDGVDVKNKLNTALQKVAGRSLAKNEVEVTAEQDPSGAWTAQVFCPTLLSAAYQSAFSFATRKQAEHAAALAALEAEHPDVARECWRERESGVKGDGKGKKRKHGDTSQEGPKTRFNNAIQILMDRNCQKGDIVYETQGDEGGPYVATVCAPGYDADQQWQGAPAADPKQAERNAAEAALAALEEVVAPLAAEKEAKKARLLEEKRAKQEDRRDGALDDELAAAEIPGGLV